MVVSGRTVKKEKTEEKKRDGPKEAKKEGKSSSHPVIILQAEGKCSWGGEGARQMTELELSGWQDRSFAEHQSKRYKTGTMEINYYLHSVFNCHNSQRFTERNDHSACKTSTIYKINVLYCVY